MKNLLKETIEELENKNLVYVTITSNDIDKIINELKIDNYNKNNDTIRFQNSMSIDSLIKCLSKYQIDKMLIEEATLDDIFLHYYQ